VALLSEGDGERQADVAEAHDSDSHGAAVYEACRPPPARAVRCATLRGHQLFDEEATEPMISEPMGRILSAIGAVILVMALFLTWYHIDRTVAQGTVDSTGWQTFTRLRVVILGGAVLLLVSALVRQTRAVLIGRTLLGLILALLILRRIVDPPDLAFTVRSQAGVFVGLIGAVCAALGGLVDTSRVVVDRYPEMAFWREPAGALGPGTPPRSEPTRRRPRGPDRDGGQSSYVDSTADEL
jgi:hypothetical protein